MKDNNPERRIPEDLVPLYNIVGEEKYKLIIKEMGGGLYYIPTKDELDIKERDRGIFEDYIIKGMKIYTSKEIKYSLEKAGFTHIETNKNAKGWLCVVARK